MPEQENTKPLTRRIPGPQLPSVSQHARPSVMAVARATAPILVAMFVVEFGIMLVVPASVVTGHPVNGALLDAGVLTLLLVPIVGWMEWRRRAALDAVRTLEGLLPICARCKKIRDEKGAWNQMEAYVTGRTGTQFSHGICPECAHTLYGDLYDETDTA